MKLSMTLKAAVLCLAAASFLPGSAYAYDDDDHHGSRGDAVIGIIGGVISSAIEAERAEKESRQLERRCARWQNRCESGSEWACEKYENNCAE